MRYYLGGDDKTGHVWRDELKRLVTDRKLATNACTRYWFRIYNARSNAHCMEIELLGQENGHGQARCRAICRCNAMGVNRIAPAKVSFSFA